MRIGLDLEMENGPAAAIQAAHQFLNTTNHSLLLFGTEHTEAQVRLSGVYDHPGCEFRLAPDRILMTDDPTRGVRRKESSIYQMADSIKRGEIDAGVSAGNTGFLVGISSLLVGKVIRQAPLALVAQLPCQVSNTRKHSYLLDAGANPEPTAEDLVFFAQLGCAYVRARWLRRCQPSVGLLTIGTEEWKGGALIKQTYQLLQETSGFYGNVENPFGGDTDIVIARHGNEVLKTAEGVITLRGKEMKKAGKDMSALRGLLYKLSGKPVTTALKQRFNPHTAGGAPLLNLKKPVIKVHGSGNEEAVYHALKNAANVARDDVYGKMKADLSR